MVLTYKNLATDEILNQFRNLNYALGNMLFGSGNNITLNLELITTMEQFTLQADVFARELLTHKSEFDFKRVLGPDTQIWRRELHIVYIYDMLQAIYYGLNSRYRMGFPKDTNSFPGFALLANLLAENSFNFGTNDNQPYSLYVNVECNESFRQIITPFFQFYPELNIGISGSPNNYSYVNPRYESIKNGLANGKIYMEGNRNSRFSSSNPLFEMKSYNDDTIKKTLSEQSFPFANSFLNENKDKFYFILQTVNSKPHALRYNESVFVSRAIGLSSKGNLSTEGNNYYNEVLRDVTYDPFTKDDVYSITGLKSEMSPLSATEIRKYLDAPDQLNEFSMRIRIGDEGYLDEIPLS